MKLIKIITAFLREYRVVVTFKSYAKETEKDGACFQFLPSINFWYKRYDPTYANGFFIGWLMGGVSIDFCHIERHRKKEGNV